MRVAVVAMARVEDNHSMTHQNFAKPTGVLIFHELGDAIRNGFEPFEKTANGYVVRTHTDAGWALALVRPAMHGNLMQ